MKNFTRFAKYFTDYILAGGNVEDYGVKGNIFKENMLGSLKTCHIFEITDDVKRLLALTKTPKRNDKIRLPFGTIFIDVSFKKEEMKKLGMDIGYGEIIGIMVNESILVRRPEDTDETPKAYSLTDNEIATAECIGKKLVEPDGSVSTITKEKMKEITSKYGYKVGTSLRITILSPQSPEDGYLWFDEFTEDVNIYDQYKDKVNVQMTRIEHSNPKARKFIHLFVLNFLNFLYDPRVKYVTVEHDAKKNEKRLNKGKFPIPSRNVIKLSGELKIYIDHLKSNPKIWTYSHSFWVHGHYRVLRNTDYWGEKAGTVLFIPAYVKGHGILIEKTYKMDKTEAVEEV